MTPRKTDHTKPINIRAPLEFLRQLDELCQRYGMNRTQVLIMLVAKEYGKFEEPKEGRP